MPAIEQHRLHPPPSTAGAHSRAYVDNRDLPPDGSQSGDRIGSPPAAVREATTAYLSAEDAIARWIDENCACDPTYIERSAILFANWKDWALAMGEFVGSQKRFTQALEDRGFILNRALAHVIAAREFGKCGTFGAPLAGLVLLRLG